MIWTRRQNANGKWFRKFRFCSGWRSIGTLLNCSTHSKQSHTCALSWSYVQGVTYWATLDDAKSWKRRMLGIFLSRSRRVWGTATRTWSCTETSSWRICLSMKRASLKSVTSASASNLKTRQACLAANVELQHTWRLKYTYKDNTMALNAMFGVLASVCSLWSAVRFHSEPSQWRSSMSL